MPAVTIGNGLGLLNNTQQLGTSQNEQVGRSPNNAYYNVVNGNLSLQAQDQFISSLGIDNTLLRTYNSQGHLIGDDKIWQFPFSRHLLGVAEALADQTLPVVLVHDDGSQSTFYFDQARNRYVSTDGGGAHDELYFDATAQQWLYQQDGGRVVDHFDAEGRFVAQSMGDQETKTLHYNDNRLTSIIDASGQQTTLTYIETDAGWRIQGIDTVQSTADGGSRQATVITYRYDNLGRLATTIIDLSPEDNDVSDGHVYETHFTYVDNTERLASIVNSDGSALYIDYQQYTGESTGLIAQNTWLVSRLSDALGNTLTMDYDPWRRLTQVTDALGRTTVYQFDAQGQLIELNQPGDQDRITTFSYDADGNLIQQTQSDGSSEAFEYDGNGNLLYYRDAAGQTIEYQYTNDNLLSAETHYLINDPDGEGLSTAEGAQTYYNLYDESKNLIFALTPDGQITEYQYNAYGEQTSRFVWQSHQFPTSSITANNPITLADMQAWLATLDEVKGQWEASHYDFRGNVSRIDRAVDLQTRNSVTEGQIISQLSVYDEHGQLLLEQDAKGGQRHYQYDGMGRLLSSQDALNQTDYYQYDDAQAKVLTRHEHGLVITETYDSRGLLIQQSSAADNETQNINYRYDSAGRLRITEDSLGYKEYFFYDSADNKIGYVNTLGYLMRWVYDGDRLVTTLDYYDKVDTSQLLYTDDSFIESSWDIDALIAPIDQSQARQQFFIYNASDELEYTVDHFGRVSQTIRDGKGQVSAELRYEQVIDTALLNENTSPAGIEGLLQNAPVVTTTNSRQAIVRDPVQPYIYSNSSFNQFVRNEYETQPLLVTSTQASRDPVQPYAYQNSAYEYTDTVQEIVEVAQQTKVDDYHQMLRWPASSLSLAEASFQYRALGSSGGFYNATVNEANGYYSVVFSAQVAVDLEFRINYANASGTQTITGIGALQLIDSASDTRDVDVLYTEVPRLATAVTGSSIHGFPFNGDVEQIAHISARVYETDSTSVRSDVHNLRQVSHAQTDPELHSDSAGFVNLTSNGQELANGRYQIALSIEYLDGSIEDYDHFIYEIGEQYLDQFSTELRWSKAGLESDQNALYYRSAYRNDSFQAATLTETAEHFVATIDNLSQDELLEFKITHQSAEQGFAGQALNFHESIGLFQVAAGAQQVDASFYHRDISSRQTGGSHLGNVIEASLWDTLDYIQVDVHNENDNQWLQRTYTYPRAYDNYQGQINLSNHEELADGRYEIRLDLFFKDGSHEARTIYYELGEQIDYQQATVVHAQFPALAPNTELFYLFPDLSTDFQKVELDAEGSWQLNLLDLLAEDEDALAPGIYDLVIEYRDTQSGAVFERRRTQIRSDVPEQQSVLQGDISNDLPVQKQQYYYNDRGLIIGELSLNGALTSYRYNLLDQLVETIHHANSSDYAYQLADETYNELLARVGVSDDDRIHQYYYDALGRKIAERNAASYVTEWRYDDNDNIIQTLKYTQTVNGQFDTWLALKAHLQAEQIDSYQEAFEYDSKNRLLKATDWQRKETSYDYNAQDLVVSMSTQDLLMDNYQRETIKRYDGFGRVASELSGNAAKIYREQTVSAQAEAWWQQNALFYHYDSNNKPLMSYRFNAAGETVLNELFVYDAAGQWRYHVNAVGSLKEQRIESNGTSKSTISYAKAISTDDLVAEVLAGENSIVWLQAKIQASTDDRVTTQHYDALNRISEATEANGLTNYYEYDSYDRLVKAIEQESGNSGNPLVHEFTYDASNQVTQQTLSDNTTRFSTEKRYDVFGQMIDETDRQGNHTTYRFDKLGRKLAVTYADNTKEYTTYDHVNRVIETVDRLGQSTAINYDTSTRSMHVVYPDNSSEVTTLNVFGEIVEFTDAHGGKTRTTFDANGQKVRVDRLAADGSLIDTVEQSSYDNKGLLIEHENAAGLLTQYQYDAYGRLLETTSHSDSGVQVERLLYNAFDQIIEKTDARGARTQYSFNNSGQLIQTQLFDANGQLSLTKDIGYDARGNKISVREQGADNTERLKTYQYDRFNRLIAASTGEGDDQQTTHYYYNALNQLWRQTNSLGADEFFVYDEFGQDQVRFKIAGNGTVTESVHDDQGRISKTTTYALAIETDTLASVLADNRLGRVEIERLLGDRPWLPGEYYQNGGQLTEKDQIMHTIYDERGNVHYQLSGQGQLVEYQYDRNRNKIAEIIFEQAIDDDDLLYRQEAISGDEIAAAIDTLDTSAIRVKRFVYSNLNQLVLSIDHDGKAIGYAHNTQGQVVKETHYATFTESPLMAYQDGTLSAAFDWTQLAVSANDRQQWSVYNERGQLSYAINTLGLVTQYQHDVSGNVIAKTEYASALDTGLIGSHQALDDSLLESGLVTSEHDRKEATLYDSLGRKIAYKSAGGKVIAWQYDSLDRIVNEEHYAALFLNAAGFSEATFISWKAGLSSDQVSANRFYTFEYDDFGNMVAKTDQFDRQTRWVYDAANRKISEQRPNGAMSWFAYNDMGQVTRIVNQQDSQHASVVDRYYDDQGNIVRETAYSQLLDISGETIHSKADHFIIQIDNTTIDGDRNTWYQYDNDNRLSATIKAYFEDAGGELIERETITRHYYDHYGRLSEVVSAEDSPEETRTRFDYDVRGNKISEAKAAGTGHEQRIQTQYNAFDEKVAELSANAYALINQDHTWVLEQRFRLGMTKTEQGVLRAKYSNELSDQDKALIESSYEQTWHYDRLGRVIETTSALGDTTTMTYDSFDNLKTITNALGQRAYHFYDHNDNVVLTLDALGYATAKQYNSDNALVAEVDYQTAIDTQVLDSGASATAILNQLESIAGQEKYSIIKSYDASGRLLSVGDVNGDQETYVYDSADNQIEVIDRNGNSKTMSYDLAGYLLEMQTPEVLVITDADSISGHTQVLVTRFSYDSFGQRTEAIKAYGTEQEQRTVSRFDQLGREYQTVAAERAVYDINTHEALVTTATTTRQFDRLGNLLSETDALGNTEYHWYNNLGQKIQSLSRAGALEEWQFDSNGNQVIERRYDQIATHHDATSIAYLKSTSDFRETYTVFDAKDQKVASGGRVAYFYSLDQGLYQSRPEVQFVYNARGDLNQITDAMGNKTLYLYNARGENVAAVDAEGYVITNTFDAQGQIVATTQYATALSAQAIATLSSHLDHAWLEAQLSNSTADRKESYQYDALGRVIEKRVHDTTSTELSDSDALTSTVVDRVEQSQYDANGNLTGVTRGAKLAGSASTTWHGEVQSSAIYYDALNRVIKETQGSFEHADGSQTTPTMLRYYDALGNVVVQAKDSHTGIADSVDASDSINRYYYDQVGQLVKTQANNGHTVLYDYDQVGNQVRKRAEQYFYDIAQGSIDTSLDTRWLTEYFYYDADQQKIHHIDGDISWDYQYNGHGDMVKKGNDGLAQEYFHYNQLGQMIGSNQGGQEHRYFYDANGNLTLQVDSAAVDLENIDFNDLLQLDRLVGEEAYHVTLFAYDGKNQQIKAIEPEVEFLRNQNGLPGLGSTHPIEYQGGHIKAVAGAEFTVDADLTLSYRRKKGPKVNLRQRAIAFSWQGLQDYNGDLRIDWQSNFNSAYTKGSHIVNSGQGHLSVPLVSIFGIHADGNYTYYSVENAGFLYQATVYKKNAQGEWELYHSMEGSYGWAGSLPNPDDKRWSASYRATDVRNKADVLQISQQPDDSSRVSLYYRRQGSSGTYQKIVAGLHENGSFAVDIAALSNSNYEYYYLSTNAAGVIINAAAGSFTKASSGITIQSHGSMDMPEIPEESLINLAFRSESDVLRNAIYKQQGFNAFGELVSSTDGNGNTTEYRYNKSGERTHLIKPEVYATESNGYRHQVRPEDQWYYDYLGRQVAFTDAAGNTSKQRYNGEFVASTIAADGGTTDFAYNEFGQKVEETNAINRSTKYEYDKAGNIITVDRIGRYDDYFVYDEKNQRIQHTTGYRNAGTNVTNIAQYSYDRHGRITKALAFGGRITSYSYRFDAAISEFGGYSKVVSFAGGRSSEERYDYFDRLRYRRDMGYNTYEYHYNDNSGWLTQQSSSGGQDMRFAYYSNGARKQVDDHGVNSFAFFDYDKNNNMLVEEYSYHQSDGSIALAQRNRASYDSLNRITAINDDQLTINYEYDQVGNRRRVRSYYSGNSAYTQDLWYDYDAMNRFVITKGKLSNGRGSSLTDTSTRVVAGSGYQLTYDAIGRRASSTSGIGREDYYYTAQGWLREIKVNGKTRTRRSFFEDGKIKKVINYKPVDRQYYQYHDNHGDRFDEPYFSGYLDQQGTLVTETIYKKTDETTYAYNSVGNTTSEVRKEYNTSGVNNFNSTTLSYYDAMGNTTRSTANVSSRNDDGSWQSYSTTTRYSYLISDSYKRLKTEVQGSTSQATQWAWEKGISEMQYDVNGNVVKAIDHHAGRILNYVNNHQGQVLTRTEESNDGDRHHRYYYFQGRSIGDVGNGGPGYIDYAQQLSMLDQEQNDKDSAPVFSRDFDASFLPVNGSTALSTGRYTVGAGDSLQSIALVLWGDASKWYLLAEVNGFAGTEDLVAGQVILVPNLLVNDSNNSSTFRPYDPSQTLGNTGPTLPAMPPEPPPSPKKCAVVAMIVIIAVTIAATVLTAGAAGAVMGPVLAGALGGIAGSVAGQLAGMALGMQKGFDWKDVAIGAITGAITGGIGQIGALKHVAEGGKFLGNVAKASIRSVGSYLGNIVAHKLVGSDEDKFTWRGLVSAGLAGAAGQALSGVANKAGLLASANVKSKFLSQMISGSITNLIKGTSKAVIKHFVVDKGKAEFDFAGVAANAVGEALGNATATGIQDAIKYSRYSDDVKEYLANYKGDEKDKFLAYFDAFEDAKVLSEKEMLALSEKVLDASQHGIESAAEAEALMEEVLTAGGVTAAERAQLDSMVDLKGILNQSRRNTAVIEVNGEKQEIDLTQDLNEEQISQLSDDQFMTYIQLHSDEVLAPVTVYATDNGQQTPQPRSVVGALINDLQSPLATVGKGMMALGETIDKNPWARYGLMALDIAAGPVKFAIGKAIEYSPVGKWIDRNIGMIFGKAVNYVASEAAISAETAAQVTVGVMGIASLIMGFSQARKNLPKLAKAAKGFGQKAKARLRQLDPRNLRLRKRRFGNVDNFNRLANGPRNGRKNMRIEHGNYQYTTDSTGRLKNIKGEVDFQNHNRHTTDRVTTTSIGQEGQTGDVGFHFVGNQYNGPINRLNVQPGNGVRLNGNPNSNLNQGDYKTYFENEVKQLLNNNQRVEIDITPEYNRGNITERFDRIVAKYRVAGTDTWTIRTFRNEPGGFVRNP